MFDFAREIAAALIVLGILSASLVALKRYQGTRESADSALRAVAKLRLSEHLVVHLVECSGVRCLVTEQRAGSSVTQLQSPPMESAALRKVC